MCEALNIFKWSKCTRSRRGPREIWPQRKSVTFFKCLSTIETKTTTRTFQVITEPSTHYFAFPRFRFECDCFLFLSSKTDERASPSPSVSCPLCQEGFHSQEQMEEHAMAVHSVNCEGLQRLQSLINGSHWLNKTGGDNSKSPPPKEGTTTFYGT